MRDAHNMLVGALRFGETCKVIAAGAGSSVQTRVNVRVPRSVCFGIQIPNAVEKIYGTRLETKQTMLQAMVRS